MAGPTRVNRFDRRRLPGLDVPRVEDQALRQFLESVKERLDVSEGARNAPKERFVTVDDLERAGVLNSIVRNNFAEIADPDTPGASTAASTSAATTTTLAALTDTDIPAAKPNDMLRFNGSKWINFDFDRRARNIRKEWTFKSEVSLEEDLSITLGKSLFIYDLTGAGSLEASHDTTDFNLDFTATTDLNLTGITVLQAGTVDADFDVLTATSYGGILEANLLDRTVAEVVSGNWDFSGAIDFAGTVTVDDTFRVYDALETDYGEQSHDGTDYNWTFVNTADLNITGLTSIQAGTINAEFDAITATSYGAVLETNLVDKSAAENILGDWTFSGVLVIPQQAVVDHQAALTITESQISDLQAYLLTVQASDVDSVAATDGFVLTADGAGNAAWEAVPPGGGGLDGTADENITGQWDFQNAGGIRIFDAGLTDYAQFSHDGADFNTGFLNTTSWNIKGVDVEFKDGVDTRRFWVRNTQDRVEVRGGSKLRIIDATAADFGDFQHDGINFLSEFSQTADWLVSGITSFTLNSTGDARLTINADTDNLGENDNPAIVMTQDGALRNINIGIAGDAGLDPIGNTITGGLQNSLSFHHVDASTGGAEGIQFAIAGQTYLKMFDSHAWFNTDSYELRFGAGDDFQIWSNGNSGILDCSLGGQMVLSSVATISGPNPVPFRINDTTPSTTNSRMQLQQEGVTAGEIGFINGIMYMRSLLHGADVVIRGENAAGSTHNFLYGKISGNNSETLLFADGVEEFKIQNSNATGNSSGAKIHKHDQEYVDVGFNVMVRERVNASFTTSELEAGGIAYYSDASNYTITLEGSDFPSESRFEIQSIGSGTKTIQGDTGVTVRFFNGDGTVTIGSFTMTTGWVTCHKFNSTNWFCTGIGV